MSKGSQPVLSTEDGKIRLQSDIRNTILPSKSEGTNNATEVKKSKKEYYPGVEGKTRLDLYSSC